MDKKIVISILVIISLMFLMGQVGCTTPSFSLICTGDQEGETDCLSGYTYECSFDAFGNYVWESTGSTCEAFENETLDLSVADVDFDPVDPIISENISVWANITNDGNTSVTYDEMTIALYDITSTSTLLQELIVSDQTGTGDFASGESVLVTFDVFSYSANGTYELQVYLDPTNQLGEAIRSDNSYRYIYVTVGDGVSDNTTTVIETCSDGIQNQDETGVDCGGSVCSACTTSTSADLGSFNVTDVTNLASSDPTAIENKLYIYTNESTSTIGNLDSSNVYSDYDTHNPSSASPLVFGVSYLGDSSQQIVLVQADVGNLYVFLPDMVYSSGTLKLFVAENGSTYYADDAHDGSGTALGVEEALVSDHLARQAEQSYECYNDAFCEALYGTTYDCNTTSYVCEPEIVGPENCTNLVDDDSDLLVDCDDSDCNSECLEGVYSTYMVSNTDPSNSSLNSCNEVCDNLGGLTCMHVETYVDNSGAYTDGTGLLGGGNRDLNCSFEPSYDYTYRCGCLELSSYSNLSVDTSNFELKQASTSRSCDERCADVGMICTHAEMDKYDGNLLDYSGVIINCSVVDTEYNKHCKCVQETTGYEDFLTLLNGYSVVVSDPNNTSMNSCDEACTTIGKECIGVENYLSTSGVVMSETGLVYYASSHPDYCSMSYYYYFNCKCI